MFSSILNICQDLIFQNLFICVFATHTEARVGSLLLCGALRTELRSVRLGGKHIYVPSDLTGMRFNYLCKKMKGKAIHLFTIQICFRIDLIMVKLYVCTRE